MADHTVSYKTLLQQCATGEATALQQIYDREASRLLALGSSLLHRSTDAEELLRESMGLIWRNADAYDPTMGSARAWIYSVLRFRAQQRLKQSPTLSPFIKTKSHLVIASDAPADLQQFLHLDERARKMLSLAYLHAYSYAEIAKECQSSINLTQKHIEQALDRLMQLFTGWHSQSTEVLRLLGVYCLGLLRDPQALAPAHALLGQDANAAKDLLLWEHVFSALAYSLPAQTPPPQLIQRIYQDLDLTPPTVTSVAAAPTPTPKTATPSRFDTPITVKENTAPGPKPDRSEPPTTKSASTPSSGNATAPSSTTQPVSRFDTPSTVQDKASLAAAAATAPLATEKPTRKEPVFSASTATPSASYQASTAPSGADQSIRTAPGTTPRTNADSDSAPFQPSPKTGAGSVPSAGSDVDTGSTTNASPTAASDHTNSAPRWKKHYWAFVVLALALIALIIWAFMPKAPTIQMVQMSPRAGAVLQAPGQSSTPGWIVSVDPEGHVLFTPQVRTELRPDEQVQLWTQRPNSTEMQSLGLIDPNQPVTVPAELIGEIQTGQIFEMTTEPKQGSSEPTGPVLFIGRIVKFGEFQSTTEKSHI